MLLLQQQQQRWARLGYYMAMHRTRLPQISGLGRGTYSAHHHRTAQVSYRHTEAQAAATTVTAPVLRLPKLSQDIQQEATSLNVAAAGWKRVLVGIDPDNSGAVAVISISVDSSSILEVLKDIDVAVHDMPCMQVSVGKRQRRQADPHAVAAIVEETLPLAASPGDLHAVLEEPVPNPTNGKQSVFGSGFAFGVWNGVLSSHRVALDTVSARRWKNDLGLNNRGKEGSRALATAIFPKATHLLRRKKDHGRAEAMLILAWALGIRVPKASETAAQLARTDAARPGALLSSSEEEDIAPAVLQNQILACGPILALAERGADEDESMAVL